MWWYVGVLLKSIKEDEVKRGDMLATLGAIKPYKKFKCKVYFLLAKEGGRKTGFACIINHNFFLEQVMLQVLWCFQKMLLLLCLVIH